MKKLVSCLALILSCSAFSKDLFIIKKSHNPENILHVVATVEKAGGKCKFVSPYVEAYWEMGKRGGDSESLTLIEKPFFAPKIIEADEQEVSFYIGILKKFKIGEQKVVARLENCEPKAYGVLKKEEIQIANIYADGKFVITWITNFIEINGFHRDGNKFYLKLEP